MDRRWVYGTLFTAEYVAGVKSFMRFVREKFHEDAEILCPCSRCLNQRYLHQALVEKHLMVHGMSSTYTRWVHHGEDIQVAVIEEPVNGDANDEPVVNEPVVNDNYDGDGFVEVLRDLQREREAANEGQNENANQDANRGEHEAFFANLMKEAKRELYPGCPNFSRFSFVVKMLHMKSYYRISNTAFSAFLKTISEAIPEFYSLPKSYNEAKKILSELGLSYESIHVCINNCVLFRETYKKYDNCPECGASRWKDAERKKIPQKVLRYFPLIPRLKRMFISKLRSEEAQWHKLKRKPKDKEMSHPADGEAWKDFDRLWPDFAGDARNLRLGIATDGFNPFGNMSSSYSMWPVFVIPYNLPPWLCMEQSNFMMALLIPGPESPGKHFDVFLQPLVEDLKKLWAGVRTFDALSGKMFDLRAAVLWCIHDYPALSTLSRRTTRGYFACLHCDKNPLSYSLRSKLGYIGHCRFLPRGHRLRRNNEFASIHESKDKPGTFTKEELLAELNKVKDVRPGQKRKRSKDDGPWGRRVSLWDLEYWPDLKLRHNLDVMHIEKNVCDNLLGTILNIEGKTKDTIKARLDLFDLNIREELQLKPKGNSFHVREARYTLSKSKKIAFCNFLREVKFPDGYASNIARCISADGTKVQGLKTHDCHIMLQRILPAGLRGIMDDDIYEAIAELGKFFRELCSKNLNLDLLTRMKGEIPIILCKLEKIFPPAFFDVMVHLAIHLPEEAILRGPVQFGWMYPIERRLFTLKTFVRNMARPEGSIAEAYIAEECLTFLSRYMDDDVETRFNRAPRNSGFSDLSAFSVDVFGHGVNLLGAYEILYSEDFDKLVWYVLNNCEAVEDYVKMFRDELERDGVAASIIDQRIRLEFATWFKNHMWNLSELEDVDDDLFALACGPDLRVRLYSSCVVNGVRFSTVERDKNKRSQNSGVVSEGTHNNKVIDFYGTLKEIIELEYNKRDDGTKRSVVLFRCDWYKLDGKRTALKDDGFFKSINTGSLWYKDDCFILATQARQMFYLPDNKFGKNWQVAQTFEHRHLFNISETDEVNRNAPAYQEEDCIEVNGRRPEVSEVIPDIPLNRDDEEQRTIDAAEVARLMKQKNVDEEPSDSEDEYDETILEYCHEDETAPIDVDTDDE